MGNSTNQNFVGTGDRYLHGDNNPEGIDVSQDNQSDKLDKTRDNLGRLLPGQSSLNPEGRPKETDEQKLVKKAQKELVADYKERLATALSKIDPILINKATDILNKDNMAAIKEINAIIVGEAPKDITSGGKPLNFKPFDEIPENKSLQDDSDAI